MSELFPKFKFMKNFIIGIDVSKDTLDFCILQKDTRRKIQQGVIANKEREILTWLKKLDKENVVVALEHTGHYGALLSWLLEEQLFTYYLINPLDLQRSFRTTAWKIRYSGRL